MQNVSRCKIGMYLFAVVDSKNKINPETANSKPKPATFIPSLSTSWYFPPGTKTAIVKSHLRKAT